ncbi:MAG TPA: 5'-3'-deoxyribonucleotidase [Acidobacteriaceae bacterium]|nr:5'-3'-deoxyribonucleotidase [Acidobacteriaceae bacterium]
MQRIAVDMDEVMADTLGELLARYRREQKTSITKDDMQGKWLWQVLPPKGQELIDSYLLSDGFFEEIPVIEGCQEVLLRMSRRYQIFIATAAMAFPSSFHSKYRWLRRHFDFLSPQNFVFCGDKSILHADYLIDDMPRNLASFQGEGILFTAPHNVNTTGYRRVSSWQDVDAMFLG